MSVSYVPSGAAAASQAQFDELQRQLNEQRGQLEVTRRTLADTREELGLRENEVCVSVSVSVFGGFCVGFWRFGWPEVLWWGMGLVMVGRSVNAVHGATSVPC